MRYALESTKRSAGARTPVNHVLAGFSDMGAPRSRQADIFSQGLTLVAGAKQAASLQLRNDHADEVIVSIGNGMEHDDESIAGFTAKPLFHLICDIRGRPHHLAGTGL